MNATLKHLTLTALIFTTIIGTTAALIWCAKHGHGDVGRYFLVGMLVVLIAGLSYAIAAILVDA